MKWDRNNQIITLLRQMLRIFYVILPYNNRNKYKPITMREKIDCFMPCRDLSDIEDTLQTLRQSKTTQHINLLIDD